jgi:hypothetical protein
MWQRGWGALSSKGGIEGNPSRNCKKTSQAGLERAREGARAQQPGAGKLVRVAQGGKLHRRGGKTHFLLEL